jgi:hypothetical protein
MNEMEAVETKTYLAHHLKLAGRSDPTIQRRRRGPDPPSQPRPNPAP